MSDAPTLFDSKRYKRELWGWLSYAFASEVFVIVSLTLFLPICLEQFARDNGFLLPDKTVPCSSVSQETQGPDTDARCVVKLGWVWIDSASFSLYVYSLSVALQALTVISMGGIADHPPHRKRLLFSFAFMGASAATLFLLLPSSSAIWPLSGLLAIFANVGFGASVVAMNAYLPTLARDSEEVVGTLAQLEQLSSENAVDHNDAARLSDEDDRPLLAFSDSEEAASLKRQYNSQLSAATSRISSLGIALGYSSGIALLALTLVPVTMLHGSTFALRLAIGISGIWWALFSVPAAFWLPNAGEDKDVDPVWVDEDREPQAEDDRDWSMGREIVAAWKRLGGMLRWREILRLRNTFVYLAAWFLLSDGFTTITSTAILFGKTTLHMSPSALILIGVITPSSGILGSLVWPMLQRRFAWSNLKVIVILVVMASLIPAYGCLGFLPVLRNKASFGGLTTQGEMFGLAVYFGSVYGAFQSYARALYAELIPPGEEARWYGLFSITDKSSSFVGPLVVGLIADTTGNIRYAFFFLVVMIWLAVPILASVDVERGRTDARGYSYSSSRPR
ncbi:MFS general substrate transporter [Dentipellis sp. KUC8613]|nr:MFS general substrate transporter [Dentipellis sp. KUC8613]